MIYQELNDLNKPISKIVFGTGVQSLTAGQECFDLLDTAYKLGITTFDTARIYGLSEDVLGKWIYTRNIRERIVIITKCGHPVGRENRLTTKEILFDFQKSCEKLKTDYIDIYLLHKDHHEARVEEVIECLNGLHAKGKVRVFGTSNWSIKRIEEANEYAYKHNLVPIRVSSLGFCLARLCSDPWGGSISLFGEENMEARNWYRKNGMPVFAYSSLGRGFLSGRLKSTEGSKMNEIFDEITVSSYFSAENIKRLGRIETLAADKGYSVSQIALAWLLNQKMNVFPIVGTSNGNRIQENICALDVKLTDEEMEYLTY